MSETSKEEKGVKVKYDWYQTETFVFITILQKNINASGLKINYGSQKVSIMFDGLPEELTINLQHQINPDGAQHKLSPFKLEIRLSKAKEVQWSKLEGDEKLEAAGLDAPPRPSKNWDTIVKDETTTEDNAVDDLFKKIYCDGSDEVRKAMNKSFRESGGTVLSTNWSDVSSGNVTMKAPEGLEWKNWE